MRIEDRRRGGRTKKEEREAQIRMLCSRNSSCCTEFIAIIIPLFNFKLPYLVAYFKSPKNVILAFEFVNLSNL